MKIYEYLSENLGNYHFIAQRANVLGQQGWRICGITQVAPGGHERKRPVPNEVPGG